MRADNKVYRDLIRLCREADRHPSQLVSLLGRPPRLYLPQFRRAGRVTPPTLPFVEDAVWESCGGSTEFSQPRGGGAAAAAAVRRHRRRAEALGLPYVGEAEQLLRRLAEAAEAIRGADLPPQAAETADGEVDLDPADLEVVPPTDPTPARVGDFLVTHPLACLEQRALDQAVVLLDELDAKVGHIRGLVLNMPGLGNDTVGDLVTAWAQKSGGEMLRDLGPLLAFPVWRGGDLAAAKGPLEDLRWLHALGGEVSGAAEVAPSVWMGGDAKVLARRVAAIGSPLEALAQVRPFIGYCGWARSQLAVELERGVWVRLRPRTAAAARALCLLPSAASAAAAAAPAPAATPPGTGARKNLAVWRAALRGAGLPALADFPRGPGLDQRWKELLERHYARRAEEMTRVLKDR